jgi:hypothetical protein
MGSLNKLVLANYGLIFGSVLALIINWPEHWREKVQRYLNKIIPIGLVCLMAWIVGRYGLSFLPDADFNLRSIRELGWYVTPVAFLLSLVGFWAFYKEGQWVWIMTGGALFAGTLFIYTWKPSITPDHFWASRRWLSFCIPLIILFSVKAIIALYQGTIKVMAAKRVAQIVSSVLVVWYVGSTVLLARPFVSTSLLASYPQGYSELAAKMKDEASKGIFFTRDGHAASILTYVYNRPTVLVHKNGVEQIESEQKKNWWTLGLSDSVMSQEYINFGSKPTFCGKYTERVRGGRPDELLTHCRQLKMNMLGETNKSEVTDQTIPATHPKLATRVGVKDTDKESLVSQGKPGCLQFGPYVKTEPGKYRITWLGDVVKSQDSQVGRVDVVANKGTLNIAKKIVDYKNNQKQDDTIAYIEFSIDEEVDDLEFRFMVTDAKVILKKIQIESIE